MDFNGIKILVFGDVMLDYYITGDVRRISPEAPVPVTHVRKTWSVPGGAANVARNLVRLGVDVTLLGMAGKDSSASELRQSLIQEGISDDTLLYSPGRRTTRKTRIMAQGQQLLRLDEEEFAPPQATERAILLERFQACLPGCDAVILSDYDKGLLASVPGADSLCKPIIEAATQLGIPVLVDPKGNDWNRYTHAQCVTPNSSEFLAQLKLEDKQIVEREQCEALAYELCSKYSFEHLLVTRGAKGMALFTEKSAPCYLRSVAREVADVSGAGDTVIATLAACIGKGLSWEDSAHIANVAAGIAVGKVGTAPVLLTELAMALKEQMENPKLFLWPALREKLGEWRRKKETIVFTNGCFDLLHPGHISLIRQCATLGDRLVVGLNTDASVRRLKGASRPIQDEQSRALLLAAMQNVDAIIFFDKDTPLDLIRQVRPDVLVKGSDYSEADVVGADIVKSYGGRVYLAHLVEGCSTTGLARRIAGERV